MTDRLWFKLDDGTEAWIDVPLLVPQLEADESYDVHIILQTICD